MVLDLGMNLFPLCVVINLQARKLALVKIYDHQSPMLVVKLSYSLLGETRFDNYIIRGS